MAEKPATPDPKRRWHQFSLRTMLIGVVAIGASLGWTGYHLRWIQQRHAVLDGRGHGAADLSLDQDFYDRLIKNGSHPAPLAKAPWALALFGELGVTEIWAPWPESSPEVRRVRALFPEAKVMGIAE